MLTTAGKMTTVLLRLHDLIDRFERWFNDRFGWFFTNGMKDRSRDGAAITSARTRSVPR